MGSAMAIGLTLGGLSAGSSFISTMQQGANQRAQAASMQSQANLARAQATTEAAKGRVEAERIERQKIQLRRKFNDMQGANRSMLAAGNVDMTSGSALDVSLGNIENFAQDIGENAYQKALAEWDTENRVKALNYQADSYDASASYLNKTSAGLGTSLLNAAISGATGFAGGYSMAGGSLTSLFSSGSTGTAGGILKSVNKLAGSLLSKVK